MARRPPQPKPTTPPADLSPFEESEEDEIAGGGIPDDDGWINLEKQEAPREEAEPKRKSARRRA